jgi:cytochrome c2
VQGVPSRGKGRRQPDRPNLHGLFGRKAGSGGGYQSSEAMVKSGIVWDDKTLVEYLKDPKGRVPGTKMVYVGLKQEPSRRTWSRSSRRRRSRCVCSALAS